MTVPPALAFADVQGGVLHSYAMPCACYLVVRAESTGALRGLLKDLVDRVTTAAPWDGDGPPSTLNLALTFPGFERLGLPRSVLDRFPTAFRKGPARRAARLGDVGASAPETWLEVLTRQEVHLLVTVHARDEAACSARCGEVRSLVDASAELAIVHERDAKALPGAREHFGYADGFAQPDVEGAPSRTTRRRRAPVGAGVALPDGRWRPVKLGEFLLGHEDEDGTVVTNPHLLLVRNGTYIVYRELRQDVALFRSSLERAARASRVSPELLAAKIVGRWRDGTPLELAPVRPATDLPAHAAPVPDVPVVRGAGERSWPLDDRAEPDPPNDFRYHPHDDDGHRCPRGAHIRRTNPRDAFRGDGRLTARQRILRRGMPYGPLFDERPDEERGLVFVCCQADIERQFETVQSQWCFDGDAFGLGDDRDPLFGDVSGQGKMTIPVQGAAPHIIDVPQDLVVVRGALYLFAPGIAALRRLAAGLPWEGTP